LICCFVYATNNPRPELVKRWTAPVCADAFSNFQSLRRERESHEHNQEARAAASWLETEGVLRAARACLNSSDTNVDLPQLFHGLGLNLRYIGLVYAQLVSSQLFDSARKALYTLVLCEACMRVFKARIRSQLRAVTSEDESDLASAAARELNCLCGSQTVASWIEQNSWVVPALKQHFNFDARGARAAVDNFVNARPLKTVSLDAGEAVPPKKKKEKLFLFLMSKKKKGAVDEMAGVGASERCGWFGIKQQVAGRATRGQEQIVCTQTYL
jgi:hypothetical protein